MSIFYKTKFEAASPTLAQINVPTNTDYLVGTELYVKGEKKDITAENVKLKTGEYEAVSDFTLTNAENEFATYNSTTGAWTFKKAVLFKTCIERDYSYEQEYWKYTKDRISFSLSKDGNALSNPPVNATQYGNMVIDGTTYTIWAAAQPRIVGYKSSAPFAWIIYAGTTLVTDELTIPVGAVLTPKKYYDPSTGTQVLRFNGVTFHYEKEVVLSPDTTVNGIPAFTMKSLDAEADKLYDVEFTDGETYNYKFKLFINEDEQSYGNIDLNGTTPAEVSAIVDDAIAAYDSQLSTVNLSGTFDDDSTFSYNFVIKS